LTAASTRRTRARAPGAPGRHEVDLDEPEDPLRLRALAVDALERAAAEGHTVLDADRMNAQVAALPISAPVSIDATTLDICAEDFAPRYG
jgi:hypothetical protein